MIREAKVVTCCPENRFCLRDGKNHKKIPVHIFELKFLHSMLYTIVKLSYVLSFLILVAEVPLKNSLLPVVLFFTDSATFCLSLLFQTLSLLFLCKNLLEILRNSSYSIISLYPVGKNYFIKGTKLSNQLMMSYV